eukprot:TRINITY_DN152_c0_g1_i4.p1 TRINITY_DN152_c0_g1~~TRINITY_DN152_c0_g1_i4.p1  ORF type:complete len:572 (-),score=121.02 TRINITY_DN152_c0_g1_i4:1560-3275(-)
MHLLSLYLFGLCLLCLSPLSLCAEVSYGVQFVPTPAQNVGFLATSFPMTVSPAAIAIPASSSSPATPVLLSGFDASQYMSSTLTVCGIAVSSVQRDVSTLVFTAPPMSAPAVCNVQVLHAGVQSTVAELYYVQMYPVAGSAMGGTEVSISGPLTALGAVLAVSVCGVRAQVLAVSSQRLEFVTPAVTHGNTVCDVVVTSAAQSEPLLFGRFTYLATGFIAGVQPSSVEIGNQSALATVTIVGQSLVETGDIPTVWLGATQVPQANVINVSSTAIVVQFSNDVLRSLRATDVFAQQQQQLDVTILSSSRGLARLPAALTVRSSSEPVTDSSDSAVSQNVHQRASAILLASALALIPLAIVFSTLSLSLVPLIWRIVVWVTGAAAAVCLIVAVCLALALFTRPVISLTVAEVGEVFACVAVLLSCLCVACSTLAAVHARKQPEQHHQIDSQVCAPVVVPIVESGDLQSQNTTPRAPVPLLIPHHAHTTAENAAEPQSGVPVSSLVSPRSYGPYVTAPTTPYSAAFVTAPSTPHAEQAPTQMSMTAQVPSSGAGHAPLSARIPQRRATFRLPDE